MRNDIDFTGVTRVVRRCTQSGYVAKKKRNRTAVFGAKARILGKLVEIAPAMPFAAKFSG